MDGRLDHRVRKDGQALNKIGNAVAQTDGREMQSAGLPEFNLGSGEPQRRHA